MSTSIRSEATRSIIAVNGVDKLAINEDGSMELLTPAANPTGNDVPTAGQLPFIKPYVSAEQTISPAGLLTLPHSLPAIPRVVTGVWVCKTAEHGYSVGDEIYSVLGAFYSASYDGLAIFCDATNISCRFGGAPNPILSIHKTSGAIVRLTNANWRLVLRAWA